MTTAKVKTISRKIAFQGWRALETITVQPKSLRHDGNAKNLTREVYCCGKVVVALLYMPETDQILFNEQFRIGAFMAGDDNPWLYECCAGIVDEGEEPEDAIRREAIEETGCPILDLEFFGKTYPSPGSSDEVFLLYCGRIGNAMAGHHGLATESEEIQTHLVYSTEALHMLDSGRITNAATIICLHWFFKNRERLRQKWGQK